MKERIIKLVTNHPKGVFIGVLLLVLLAASQIPRIKIDTDPENMLSKSEPVRVFNDKIKKRFSLHEMIVVGMVNNTDPDGVFNPRSLARVHKLAKKIQQIDGVIQEDLMSPSTVDNIIPKGMGTLSFDWLLKEAPRTREEARKILAHARRIPTLRGTLVSEDGRAIAIYVPIKKKDESHRISTEIQKFYAEYKDGGDSFFITGLPVAEDTFGYEMFLQMAISAPAAAVVIFILMWWFFRSFALITSPMLVAMATVIITMGMLIGFGFTVHIMSSMIPIFLMPIAVVDSVHILSEFSDLYRKGMDKKELIRVVMTDLFKPMLFTSLTSAAGFASLAFTPIPPVQVFGVFVAFGILLAFALTVVFIPAYVVKLSPAALAKLPNSQKVERQGLIARQLDWAGGQVLKRGKIIIAVVVVLVAISAYGISKIQINDNPVRWFKASHPIRVSDKILNQKFAGTYPAFLVLTRTGDKQLKSKLETDLRTILAAQKKKGQDLSGRFTLMRKSVANKPYYQQLQMLVTAIDSRMDKAPDAEADAWEPLMERIEKAQLAYKYFQNPALLRYIDKLQRELESSKHVGKTSSIVDLVKTVNRDLFGGKAAKFAVPKTVKAVGNTLLTYQSSHRPHDLWHFVTPNFRSASIWVQLKSGDNKDMSKVVEQMASYLKSNPPPAGVEVQWAGSSYINVVWQDKMVRGMLSSLAGAFVVVFLMMVFLFRSTLFGLLSMVPLTVTITAIYGMIGLVGKDYDMPVAVISSLTLGLSVDFAIHFLQRSREVHSQTNNWRETVEEMFQEPGRAITRNAIVIAIGFLPLLLSPLAPYNTVGFLMAGIMTVSSMITVLLLPSLMGFIVKALFRKSAPKPDAVPAKESA